MRPNRLTVPQSEGRSFDVRRERLPHFTNPWHFHPELELNFVVASTGTRFIGQRVQRFESGEIVLLGANLPHFWKNDAAYYHPESPVQAEAVVVRFAEHFAGPGFFHLPETRPIATLFARAAGGLKLLEPLRSRVAAGLLHLPGQGDFEQLTALIGLLHAIATSEAIEVISPHYAPSPLLAKHNERLSRVIGYLVEHVTQPLDLARLADLAAMNPAALCRFFKTQTGQTLTQYLTDLRLRYACELLAQGDVPVAEVGFQAGFETPSHFIQTFRKKHHLTPAAYRKQRARLG